MTHATAALLGCSPSTHVTHSAACAAPMRFAQGGQLCGRTRASGTAPHSPLRCTGEGRGFICLDVCWNSVPFLSQVWLTGCEPFELAPTLLLY